MTTIVLQGAQTTLVAEIRAYADGPAEDLTGVTIAIESADGTTTVLAATSTGISHPATGVYTYVWTVDTGQAPGGYLVTWSGTDTASQTVTATELVTVATVPTYAGQLSTARRYDRVPYRGETVNGSPIPGAHATLWDAVTGGNQVTNITALDGTPIPGGILVADSGGWFPGFYDLNKTPNLYIIGSDTGTIPGVDRVLIEPSDTDDRVLSLEAFVSGPGGLDERVSTLEAASGSGSGGGGGGGGTLTVSARPALAVVYAAGYPVGWRPAGDTYTFVCDGSDDQNDINTAIAAVVGAGEGHGDVYLAGDRFNLSGSIQLKTGVWLRGGGFNTELRATADFNAGMIELINADVHMAKVSDLYLNGASKGVHGLLLDNTNGSFVGKPASSPDSAHVVKDLFIYDVGSAAFAGHALLIRGNNSRANKLTGIRALNASGCGVWADGSHDSHYTDIEVGASGANGPAASSSSTAPVGAGFYISGGNNLVNNCKAFYSRLSGFYHNTVRTSYVGCQSQDNYSYGFEVSSTAGSRATFTGCYADSNGQAAGAGGLGRAGFYLPASLLILAGCMSFDRGGQSWVQQYGIQFTSSCKWSLVDAITFDNGASSTTGTPDASTTTRITSKNGL